LLINGVATETLSAHDRGLAYGDGHFTTILINAGKPVWWPAHRSRLQQANVALGLADVDWDLLTTEVTTIAAGHLRAVIKVVLTRGQGGRGYDGSCCQTTTRLVSLSHYPSHYPQWQQQGLSLLVCQQQLGDVPMLAGLKTLNRLEQVLLKKELVERGGVEGIVLNNNGFIVEAVSANLFWRCGQTLFTPLISHSGIDGIMRQWLITVLKQMGLELQIVTAPLASLWAAEEVWLTNSLLGIAPVTDIQDRHHHQRYSQSSLTRHLQERLALEV
jgi:4-amino-4-deoxychorismate lyase